MQSGSALAPLSLSISIRGPAIDSGQNSQGFDETMEPAPDLLMRKHVSAMKLFRHRHLQIFRRRCTDWFPAPEFVEIAHVVFAADLVLKPTREVVDGRVYHHVFGQHLVVASG